MTYYARATALLAAGCFLDLASTSHALLAFCPRPVSHITSLPPQRSALHMAGRRQQVDRDRESGPAAMGNKIRPGDIDAALQKKKSKKRRALDEIESASDLADVAASIKEEAEDRARPDPVAAMPGAEDGDAPQVAQIIVDEDTGLKSVQTGNAIMDVTTRRAVVLSPLGPEYRLAEMFPGVPPEVRAKCRYDLQNRPMKDFIEEFAEAVKADDGTYPPVGSNLLTDAGMDYLLANRDNLGERMKLALTALKLQAQSKLDLDGARRWRDVRQQLIVLELKASGPFRQVCLQNEQNIGPNFGNLDVASYCGGELYERVGAWVVLKGLVALWEKRTRDQQWREDTPMTSDNMVEWMLMGDPRILLPKADAAASNVPPFYSAEDCGKIAIMCRKMSNEFVINPALFDDLPVELRYLEKATVIPSGTELRKFTVNEFCVEEDISLDGLIEGIKRFEVMLESMMVENYSPFLKVITGVRRAISVGTPEEIDPFSDYIDDNQNPNSPGHFEVYHEDPLEGSMMEYLAASDTAKNKNSVGDMNVVLNQLGIKGELASGIGDIFGFSNKATKVKEGGPSVGGTGRELTPKDDPAYHNNWLDALDDELRDLESADDRRRATIEEEAVRAAEARRAEGAKRVESTVAGGVLIEYEVDDDGEESAAGAPLFDFLEKPEKELPPRKLNMFELSTYVYNEWAKVANSPDGVEWNGPGEETEFTGKLFEEMGAKLFTQREIDKLGIYPEDDDDVPSDEWYLKGFDSEEDYRTSIQKA